MRSRHDWRRFPGSSRAARRDERSRRIARGAFVTESPASAAKGEVMRSFRILAAAVALVPGWAVAQHDHAHEVPENFGQVHFATSCRPDVQPAFERALA